jgi:hypothetical protein
VEGESDSLPSTSLSNTVATANNQLARANESLASRWAARQRTAKERGPEEPDAAPQAVDEELVLDFRERDPQHGIRLPLRAMIMYILKDTDERPPCRACIPAFATRTPGQC